jgi:hypothetical protein
MQKGTRWLAVVAMAMMFSTTALAQETVDVTFRIDMTALIDSCQYMEARGDTIAVRGTFNEWSNEGEWTILEDTGENNVYAATIEAEVGTELIYKFWTNRAPWEDGDDRRYTPTAEAEQVLPIAEYRKTFSNICGADMETLFVEFAVNMDARIRSGSFNPETDNVVVRGTFNGWSGDAHMLEPFPLDPTIYSTVVEIDDFAVPGTIEYKFVTRIGDADGWEGIPNRVLTITGNEPRDDEGRLLVEADEIPYFDNATPDMLFSQPTTLTLRVDARPAFYFLADSGFVPSDVQTSEEVQGFSNVFINGPISNVDGAGDWYSWGPENLGLLETRKFTPSAENDSIFVWTRTFNENEGRRWVGKFGLDGYDNESGFGADHVFIVPDEPNVTIDVIFGSERDNDGNVLYSPYIGFDANDNPFVRRNPQSTNIEVIGGELPAQIALDQNYPNPFNPTTTFEYRIDAAQHVVLKVYDVLGREVATLVDGMQPASSYRVSFDAGSLPSATYLYQLRAGSQVITRTMTLLK